MPVTLSGNTHSQPEHPPSTEPTELSGTGLGRTGRPGLHGAVREKARVCHPRHTSLVKSVRPSPDRNTATIVALSFVFLFFLSNTSATECKFPHQFSVRNKQLYGNCSRTSWVQYFSDRSVRWWTFCCYLKHWCYFVTTSARREEEPNQPTGVITGPLSNRNTGSANYPKWHITVTHWVQINTVRQSEKHCTFTLGRQFFISRVDYKHCSKMIRLKNQAPHGSHSE